MGTFKTKEDYLKALCVAHPTVAHGTVVDGITRNSFFRLNNDEEILRCHHRQYFLPGSGLRFAPWQIEGF